METPAKDRMAAAAEELIKGRGVAARLSKLVQKTWPGDSSAAMVLINEVMASFSRALYVLDSGASDRIPAIDEAKSVNCGKKRKSSGAGRGSFRKRKHAWRTITSKTYHDEYSWRKYGQKEIHSSKFPRSYFRCTHKHDQGCQATKQVQKSEADPSLLEITYIGDHTCTKHHNITPTLINPSTSSEPSMISFGSNTSNVTNDSSLPSSPLFQEEVLSNHNQGNLSSDFFDLLEPLMSEYALQRRDNLDESFVFDPLDFEEGLFNFDQGHLFRD